MAFLKHAKAMVVHPRTNPASWSGMRKAASAKVPHDLSAQASEILGVTFNPDQYLLTHCTIVGSVEVDSVPGAKLGTVKTGSKTINRKYSDFYIHPESSAMVNNNGDSWSRAVLLKSYRTFIGAHNFQEHVQIEEQSKGRVIDAAARDVGSSLYIDILVATDRKHVSLVQDIESGKTATLSMGCTTDFTICSNCGHVAADETELCDHIRYAKLNTFMDDQGNKRVIAELCGHTDYDDTGGVQFIEASWVATPAFSGAVLRNILGPSEATAQQLEQVLSTPPQQWSEDALAKAASTVRAFDFGGGGDEEGGEEKEPEKPTDPFSVLEESLYDMVKKRVQERLEKDMSGANVEEALGNPGAPSTWPNDTLQKEGMLARYKTAIRTVVRVASSDVALVDGVAAVNASYGVKIGRVIYRAVLSAGSPSSHSDLKSFLSACRTAAGREMSPAEVRVAIRVGYLLSKRDGKSTQSVA
jgi:hypothetical protein